MRLSDLPEAAQPGSCRSGIRMGAVWTLQGLRQTSVRGTSSGGGNHRRLSRGQQEGRQGGGTQGDVGAPPAGSADLTKLQGGAAEGAWQHRTGDEVQQSHKERKRGPLNVRLASVPLGQPGQCQQPRVTDPGQGCRAQGQGGLPGERGGIAEPKSFQTHPLPCTPGAQCPLAWCSRPLGPLPRRIPLPGVALSRSLCSSQPHWALCRNPGRTASSDNEKKENTHAGTARRLAGPGLPYLPVSIQGPRGGGGGAGITIPT